MREDIFVYTDTKGQVLTKEIGFVVVMDKRTAELTTIAFIEIADDKTLLMPTLRNAILFNEYFEFLGLL